tara:strand:- start:1231 stop:3057 length:1827 start_codon:yes stop_codon:yes gene_type:complete
MDNGFSNLSLTTSFQNIQGGNKYKVKTLDFDTCGDCCNITACEGGIINICAKVKFKEGFIFDGDICDIDGGATFRDFTATEGYYVESNTSTCAAPIARTRAVSYYTDLATPALSTIFRNYAGTQGDAKLIINSTANQPTLNPATDNYGMIIRGGDLTNTRNIRMEADGTVGGAIEIFAHDDIEIQSDWGKLLLESTREEVDINANTNVDIQALVDVTINANEKIEIETHNDVISIYAGTDIDLDATGGKVSIEAETDIDIEAKTGDILIKSDTGDITLDADATLTLKCHDYELDIDNDYTLDVNGDILIKSDTGDIELDAHDKLILKCNDFELDIGNSYTLDVNGDILIKSDTGKIDVEAFEDLTLKSDNDSVLVVAQETCNISTTNSNIIITSGDEATFVGQNKVSVKSVDDDVEIHTLDASSKLEVISGGSTKIGSAMGQLEIVSGINVPTVPPLLIHSLKGDVEVSGGPGAGADVDDLKLKAPGGHIDVLSKDTITINSGVGGVGAGDINIKTLTGLGDVTLDASNRVRFPTDQKLNVAQNLTFPPTGGTSSKTAKGVAGDQLGDVVFGSGALSGSTMEGYIYVCFADYTTGADNIWGRVKLESW